MPIERRLGESKDEFLSRCIATEIEAGKDNDQAAAICYTQLKKVNMAEEVPTIQQADIDYSLAMLRVQNPSYVGTGALKICISSLTEKKQNQEYYGIDKK